jgi:hypothetical protein
MGFQQVQAFGRKHPVITGIAILTISIPSAALYVAYHTALAALGKE